MTYRLGLILLGSAALGCGTSESAGTSARPAPANTQDAAASGADAAVAIALPDASSSAGWDATTISAPPAGEACQEVIAEQHAQAPDMLIVLDRSGSMIGFGTELGVDRWQPSKRAVTSITTQFQELIAFGLSMFAAADPSGVDLFSCATGALDVPLATGSAGAITQAMELATPFGGATPTGATLEAAARVFGDRTPRPDGESVPAYVLLVTDGEPTCEEGPLDTTPASIARANAAIEQLAARGVKTYVVGYGVSGAADTMNGFAQRGGTERFYPVESEAQLVAEFGRISSSVVTCAYELELAPLDRLRVLVQLDGKQLNLDPADGHGWTLHGKTVQLVGGACDTLKDGERHQVLIREVCYPVPPI